MKLDPRQVKSKEKLHDAYLSLLIEGHVQLSIQQVCTKAQKKKTQIQMKEE
ncbi:MULTISPECIES: hypothetical protein [unclassified Lysinibacillus]|uniref:hypothetical protein n=1 Tax=unclassified Lysinibacillus TaxID=2636778 RepID=UPI00131ED85E|nr:MULTISPECIES: hypothetical protein [unclassified Lysinibacillus]